MRHTIRTLLTGFIALSLVFSLLQGAMASPAVLSEQGLAAEQMMDEQQHGVSITHNHFNHGQPQSDDCPNDSECSTSQCALCVIELQSENGLIVAQTGSSFRPPIDNGAISQLSSLLYRPPRD